MEFSRIGELLWLDFANTIEKRKKKEYDAIPDFRSFVQFLLESSVITPAIQADLERNWSAFEQNRAFLAAQSFRKTLRKLAMDLIKGRSSEPAPAELNEMLSFQNAYTQIGKTADGYELRQHRDFTLAEHLLAPIAESAAWLLCNGHSKLLRICSNPECGLFFYDTTRNHARRWCSMQTCGNRNKVDAYLRRKHQNGNVS